MMRWLAIALIVAGGMIAACGAYIPAKAALAQVLLRDAFHQASVQGYPVKPWSWADMDVVGKLYLPNNAPLIVVGGGTGQALAFAPALLRQSTPAHRVISAHRDTHFVGLDRLRRGDSFEYETIKGALARYEIQAIAILPHDEIHLATMADEQLLSLITCWPINGALPNPVMRYVVTARKT